ncbi:acyltransferase family protein [Herbaspirillum lusitanum]|uniref:Acyltransferase family protein n=1 Tax=Herbaspirillum lusitanum TaxID=213312 RepID=A0ABW9AA11_9BURK
MISIDRSSYPADKLQTTAAPATKAHIGEIDGLRAVAVMAVLLYHVGFTSISGGFVGVDVFFVISGYLITGILLAAKDSGRQSLARFYARRILRIAPALYAMLIVTALVFFMLLPPGLSGSLLNSLSAAAFSYSNFWFYTTTDYFANDSTNPVLHTWSLAVEEQFYLVFPLLLLAIGKSNRRRLILILLLLFFVSFVAAAIVTPVSQYKAFYFPWLRSWELLAGSLLAAMHSTYLSERIWSLLSNVGLAVIVAACFLYNEKMVFPGMSALLPVMGAAGILAGVGSNSIANWILRLSPMRWIGKISYSLYLVHWPLTCLAGLTVSLYPRPVKWLLLMLSLLLAWLSWRFVEKPFRAMAERFPAHKIMLAFGVACVGLFPYFMGLQLGSLALWQSSPDALKYAAAMEADVSLFNTGKCFLTQKYPDMSFFDSGACLGQAPGVKSALVIGDSHAANIVPALSAQHPSVKILQATAVGCKPTLDTGGPLYCRSLIEHVLRKWLPDSGAGVDTVVIAARWEKGDVDNLRRTVLLLSQMGKRVIVYGPSPEYFVAVPQLLVYQKVLNIELSHLVFRGERVQLHDEFKSIFSKGATYFSSFDNLCNARICKLESEDAPNFSDRDHFTRTGAMLAVKGFPLP